MLKLIQWAGYIKKALAAASAALIVTGTALQDSAVSGDEITAIVAAWAAVIAVFQLSNGSKPTEK